MEGSLYELWCENYQGQNVRGFTRFLRTNGLPLALFVAFLAVSGAAVGQSFSSLRGIVTDSSGGAIPEAQVNLTLESTGIKRTTSTNGRGAYEFVHLQPGTYNLEVSSPGFAVAKLGSLELLVNLPATVNIVMQVATATQTVQVVANVAPLINTVNASQGEAFNEIQVSQLPIEARNVVSLLSLQPGVTYLGDRIDGNGDTRSACVSRELLAAKGGPGLPLHGRFFRDSKRATPAVFKAHLRARLEGNLDGTTRRRL
ncbi:MAG: carboxypeptidase-like regulatory domain-containing protein [Terriglobia bacterium]